MMAGLVRRVCRRLFAAFATAIGVSVWLVPMSVGASDSLALVTIYQEDFSAGSSGWRFYPRDVESQSGSRMIWSSEGFVVSKSPWWADQNHIYPGPGALHLLAVLWMRGKFNGLPFESIDLRDARLRFRMSQPVPLKLHGARLVFWFQTVDDSNGKFVNYALTSVDLARALHPSPRIWREVELTLGTAETDWTCLGSREEKSDIYGCASSVEMALSRVTNDFGLILLPIDMEQPPTGAFALDDVQLLLKLPRSSTTTEPAARNGERQP
jgi:hypothetical protein